MTEPNRIHSISAVTLFVTDMHRSVAFYTAVGFDVVSGRAGSGFTSLAAGDQFLNLMAASAPATGWGRVIFHVDDVDEQYRRVLEAGLDPEAAPRDAEWGERYFHLDDPDGHQLSFARPLR